MEVIVKSSPKIEIEFATKVVKIGSEVTVDSALSTESENPVQNKVVTEELGKKVDKQGTYPNLTAGDLAGRGESVPAEFGFRASGGKSIKDGRAYIKRIKGNSVVWNQLLDGTWGGSYEKDGDIVKVIGASYTSARRTLTAIPIGHKVLFGAVVRGGKGTIQLQDGSQKIAFEASDSWKFIGEIKSIIVDNSTVFYLYKTGDDDVEFKDIFFHDLTKMFGAGNEPTTIEDFYARVATLGVDMNAYNEGQVIHCNTESIKSVGDNAWDEEWELGRINSTGGEMTSNSHIRSKNYNRCIPGETMYITCPKTILIDFYDVNKEFVSYLGKLNETFVVPANACYFKISSNSAGDMTAYNHDICIRLAHTGYKTDYEPYWQDTLPLPIIRKYFPQGMKSAGSAHDEIRYNKASGKWEYSKGRLKRVDLGSLTWNYYSSSNTSLFKPQFADIKIASSNDVANMLCAPYTANNANTWQGDKTIVATPLSGVQIWIHDEAYKDNLEAFKADMQGVILYYETNDWEWVELDAEDQNFRDYYNVADFGTEQSQSSVPSAAFSADIIYQFNAVDMIREHEIEITELQNVIATMQAQLTALTNGGQ